MSTPPHRCACILLAAGQSSRLGFPKQLLRINGETLLHRSARLAVETGLQPVCVVLGSSADACKGELRELPVSVMRNDAWQEGMSTSLRVGLDHLAESFLDIHHALIMVCDQVALTAAHLSALLRHSQSQPEKIIASFYGERSAVPAIFPRQYFRELIQLKGDQGARHFMQHASDALVLVPFPGGELDIDTPKDLERAAL